MGRGKDTGKNPQKKTVERRILDRAADLFFQFGFKRVTMDDISKALGMSKKTLYQHARGKDSLVEMFVDDLVEKAVAQASSLFDENTDIVQLTQRLAAFVSAKLQMVSGAMLIDLQKHWPHLWARANARRMKILERYEGVIERSIEKGILRSELHPKVMVKMVQVLISEVMNPKTLLELEVAPQDALRTLVTVLLYGALSDEGRKHKKED